MFMTTQDEKAKLRKLMLRRLKQQSLVVRKKKSQIITSRLREDSSFLKSHAFMFYVPTEIEVDPSSLMRELLKMGCCLTVPAVERTTGSLDSIQIFDPDEDLIPGNYGIRQPRQDLRHSFDVSRLDLVLVPGLAFDQAGHRLGRGKGYYDRFLNSLPSHVKRIGLAFDFQVFDSIPSSESDARVDRVITDLPPTFVLPPRSGGRRGGGHD